MATSLVRYFDAFLVNHRPHHIQDVLSRPDLPGRKHAPHMGVSFLTTYVISARVCVETAGCAAQHEKHNPDDCRTGHVVGMNADLRQIIANPTPVEQPGLAVWKHRPYS